MPEIVTDWIDRYQDREDNYVVVSQGDLAQPAEYFDPGEFIPAWYDDVLALTFQRIGDFRAQKPLGGPAIYPDALAWVNEQARFGYSAISHTWDGTTPDPLPGVEAEDLGTGVSVGWFRGHEEEGEVGIGTPEAVEAAHTIAGTVLWVAAVKPNLDPQGGLVAPNPLDDGLPLEAEIEWESDFPDLIGVAFTGDEIGRAAGGSGAMPVHYIAHSTRDPQRDTGAWLPPSYNQWETGVPLIGSEPAEFIDEWDYTDGDPVWQEQDISGHGVTGWDGWALLPYGGEAPGVTPFHDAIVVHMAVDTWAGTLTPALGSETRAARLAVRFQLRAPRFRWRYEVDSVGIPMRRVEGRPHPARVFPDGTYQNGRRALGGIL